VDPNRCTRHFLPIETKGSGRGNLGDGEKKKIGKKIKDPHGSTPTGPHAKGVRRAAHDKINHDLQKDHRGWGERGLKRGQRWDMPGILKSTTARPKGHGS